MQVLAQSPQMGTNVTGTEMRAVTGIKSGKTQILTAQTPPWGCKASHPLQQLRPRLFMGKSSSRSFIPRLRGRQGTGHRGRGAEPKRGKSKRPKARTRGLRLYLHCVIPISSFQSRTNIPETPDLCHPQLGGGAGRKGHHSL